MRTLFLALCILAAPMLRAQTVTSVYNRDTHEPFHLKKVSVESTVIGPIVRTSTLLTYDNPYKNLTEATLNFEMPHAAALGGFAYYFGQEYVPGQLMDKNKAWFIYTAITSRNRDPGIMGQWSPSQYHCQIFPIKVGKDLKVRLWTVGVLQPSGDTMVLPKPSAPRAVSYYATQDASIVPIEWTVRSVRAAPIQKRGADYTTTLASPVSAVAQRYKDGRIYVAGIVRTPDSSSDRRCVKIEHAFYEPGNGQASGADVTDKV